MLVTHHPAYLLNPSSSIRHPVERGMWRTRLASHALILVANSALRVQDVGVDQAGGMTRA